MKQNVLMRIFFDYYDKFISFKYIPSYDDNYIFDFISFLTAYELKSCKEGMCIERNLGLNPSSINIKNYIDDIGFKEGDTYLLGIKYYYDDDGNTEFTVKDKKQCSERVRGIIYQFSDIFKEHISTQLDN